MEWIIQSDDQARNTTGLQLMGDFDSTDRRRKEIFVADENDLGKRKTRWRKKNLQREVVTYIYIYCKGSLDEKLWQKLALPRVGVGGRPRATLARVYPRESVHSRGCLGTVRGR